MIMNQKYHLLIMKVNAETNKNLQFKQMTNLFHSGSSLTASLVEFTNLAGCYNKEKGMS